MYIKVYKDKADEYRWSFKSDNNETLADSGEGYQNRMDMYRALQQVCGGFMGLSDEADASPKLIRQHDEIPVRTDEEVS